MIVIKNKLIIQFEMSDEVRKRINRKTHFNSYSILTEKRYHKVKSDDSKIFGTNPKHIYYVAKQ